MLRKKEASFGGVPTSDDTTVAEKKKMKGVDLSGLSGINEMLEQEEAEAAEKERLEALERKRNAKETRSSCRCWQY